MSLFDQQLRFLARNEPERSVLICQHRVKTAAQLEERVAKLSVGLLRRVGLQPGDLIALVSLGTEFFLETLLACTRAGLVAVLVNWRWSEAEAAQALSICGPRALVLDQDCHGFTSLHTTVSSIESTIFLDGHVRGQCHGVFSAEDLIDSTGTDSLVSSAASNLPAVICFTSGSTGERQYLPAGACQIGGVYQWRTCIWMLGLAMRFLCISRESFGSRHTVQQAEFLVSGLAE